MLNNNLTFLKVYTLVSTIVYVVVNTLIGSGIIKIGSGSQKTISDKYYTFVTPSGWAFSIWSFLFILQVVWAIYQVLPTRRDEKEPLIRSFNVFLPIAFHFQTIWPVVFSFEQIPLSFFIILSGWIFLLISYFRISSEYSQGNRMDVFFYGIPTGKGDVYVKLTLGEKLLYLLEFFTSRVATALNLGWVTLATFVNFASLMEYYGKGLSEDGSVVLLVFAAVLALSITIFKRDQWLPLPVAWGIAAVITAHHGMKITNTSSVLVALLLLVSVFFFGYHAARRYRGRKNEHNRLIDEQF